MTLTNPAFTHIAFADETSYNIGRYPGIALVSLPHTHVPQVKAHISHILTQANVQEFKWERLSSAKRRFAAMNLIQYAIEQASQHLLRIDVLTWDMKDGRHNVPKLDKIANLQRMYYHLFHNVLRARWPDDAIWQLCPDEHTAMSWEEVHDYLDIHSVPPTTQPVRLDERLQREFRIHQIKPCQSHTEPLIQLADLFAGLGSYSRTHYTRYLAWQRSQRSSSRPPAVKLSHADRERCYVIAELDQQCKNKRLGVSLKTYQGLRTLNPKKPVNFWWYTPQHDADTAPTRA